MPKKQGKAAQPRKSCAEASSSGYSATPATPPAIAVKIMSIFEGSYCEFGKPGDSLSEEEWGTDLEDAGEKATMEEEDVDLEGILAPPIPAGHQKKGNKAGKKPRIIARSGRVVKVVHKDNM